MASDTASPAPGPHTPPMPAQPPTPPAATPDTQARGLGWLASALQPVDPARPTFDLTPTLGADGTVDPAATGGASSAAYHDGTGAQSDTTGKNSTGSQEKGVVRAWLLAGAERWRKGADARNKALDIRKAKATALQVKEARTVNRSEKIVGGSTNTATSGHTSAGKSNSSKTNNSGSTGPKNTSSGGGGGKSHGPGGSGKGGSGGGAGNGRGNNSGPGRGNGGTGGGSAGSGTGGGGKAPKNTNSGSGSNKGPAAGSGTSGGGNNSAGNSANGKSSGGSGSSGNHGSSGKPGKNNPAAQHNNSGKTPKPQTTTTTCGNASGISTAKPQKQKAPQSAPAGKTPAQQVPGNPGQQGGQQPTGTGGQAPTRKNTGGQIPARKTPLTKGGQQPNTKPAPGNLSPQKNPAQPAPQTPTTGQQQTPTGPTVRTQATREAGYRDGTRLGQAVAHAGAYKDGVKDGYRDTSEAASREKDRLDKAHQKHKQGTAPQPGPAPVPPKPTAPPKPTTPPPTPTATPLPAPAPVPKPAKPATTVPDPRTALMKPKPKEETVAALSSADYHPPQTPAASPIGVSRVGQTHVVLNSGQVISRGEVRNLKDYERRLDEKTIAMNKLADLAKSLQAHAQDQNKEVTTLLEQARTKFVGDAVIGDLTKLQERTALQAHQAAELLKRAIRAAESTTVLLANVTTRYGGIYKAVCDSPLEIPGELDFYDDRTATSV